MWQRVWGTVGSSNLSIMKTSTIVHKGMHQVYDVFGPMLEFLTSPSDRDAVYCVMKGTIPPGISVPLHSHPDDESFYILSGVAKVLTEAEDKLQWRELKPGDFVHIHGSTKHAWKNDSTEPLVTLGTTTPKLGRFFQEVGRPITPGKRLSAPTTDELQNFVQVSLSYGHWLASPEENAAIGIPVFGAL